MVPVNMGEAPRRGGCSPRCCRCLLLPQCPQRLHAQAHLGLPAWGLAAKAASSKSVTTREELNATSTLWRMEHTGGIKPIECVCPKLPCTLGCYHTGKTKLRGSRSPVNVDIVEVKPSALFQGNNDLSPKTQRRCSMTFFPFESFVYILF